MARMSTVTPKLGYFRDGLVTGSGSGQLLDYVTAHSPRRLHSEVVLLIAQTAAVGAHEWGAGRVDDDG